MHFRQYNNSDIARHIRVRHGETKLGEAISVPGSEPLDSFLQKTSARFVVLGIAEDIGVLANGGNGGTAGAWDAFLVSFLNIQANDFTKADSIAVIGHFCFDALKEKVEGEMHRPEERLEGYRKAVSLIDDEVAALIQRIVVSKKTPVVVGGGHNNAYPIIKGVALGTSGRLNCVNLDAHIDYRRAEGRHSGNGFRYAKQEGFLLKYFALAIHENFIPGVILEEVSVSRDIDFITYEDVFVRQKTSWPEALELAGKFIGTDINTGIELDLDSIEYVPSSAATPCGVTPREALQFVFKFASHHTASYLHICEGISTGAHPLVGKMISYVVSNFVNTLHR